MHTLAQLQAGELKHATRVKIAEGLTEFPKALYNLADTLEALDLSDNRLTTLPDDFNRLHKLKIFFASNNPFDHLPEVLATCPNLEMIGFKANQIATVAENALPKKTRWLILTDNKLTHLPNSLGDLQHLKKLMLAGNQLQTLPESMARCSQLQLVRLSANQLTELPDWLLKLPQLAWLAFSGNPLCGNAPKNEGENETRPTVLPTLSLDDFQLSTLLGQGASGLIYQATLAENAKQLEASTRQVAVKLFKGEVTSDGLPQDELKACITAGSHANLVRVLAEVNGEKLQEIKQNLTSCIAQSVVQSGTQNLMSNIAQKGLVMSLIPKRFGNLGQPPSLQSCTRDQFADDLNLSLAQIIKIMLQVTDALQHLHAKQLCHGDLYAHNILMDDAAQILLSDLGAASHFGHLSSPQQTALQTIEKRALGHLLEDLLNLCTPQSKCPQSLTKLSELQQRLVSATALNLSLAELKSELLILEKRA